MVALNLFVSLILLSPAHVILSPARAQTLDARSHHASTFDMRGASMRAFAIATRPGPAAIANTRSAHASARALATRRTRLAGRDAAGLSHRNRFSAGAAANVFAPRPKVAPASVPDGAGGQYMLWSEVRDGDADLFLLRITNTGAPAAGWPATGLAVCNAPGDQADAALFSDGGTGVIAGWLDQRDGWRTTSAYGQHVNASGVPQWTTNGVKVLDWSALIGDVEGAPDGAGGLYLVWEQDDADVNLYGLHFTSAGVLAPGWSTTGNVICDATDDQIYPLIAPDGAGGAIIVWEDHRDALGVSHAYAQRMNGSGVAQWTANGVQVDASVVGIYDPTVCEASAGHSIVSWGDYGGPAYAQRLNGSGVGQWTAGGEVLHPGTGIGTPDGDFLSIPDGSDGAIVIWYTFNGAVHGLQSQRIDATGAVQWGASGASILSSATIYPDAIDFVADGSGGAYYTWTDNRSGPEYDIYLQHVTAAGALSWAANGIAACIASGDQRDPSIALDGSGGCLVSWLDGRSLDIEIYTQRFDAAGLAIYAGNGVASYTNPGVQVGSATVQTADGGALVIWNEKRGGEYDIRVRKLDENGTPTGPGSMVCAEPGNQLLAAGIEDGAGGAIVVWGSLDSGDENLYARRILSDGTPVWAASGVAVCTALGAQDSPSLISDGSGGAIITWWDGRSPDGNIYAQRISGGGAAMWAANGVAVCTDPGFQDTPGIASDGGGGAIIAWGDLRSFASMIYAQRLNSSGAPQWTANGVAIADYSASFSIANVSGMVAGTSNDAIVLIHELVPDLVTFEVTSALHAQNVDASGAPQWGTTGTLLVDAGSLCRYEQGIDDGFGGAYFAWAEDRDSPADIYAQRVNASGNVTWSANGNVVCDATGWQYLGSMTRSGSNLFFTWADERAGQADIYAHDMDATAGTDVWTHNGEIVSLQAHGQFYANMAPWRTATPERLYLTWTDDRTGTERIVYAERLDFNGAAQWSANGVVSTNIALSSAEANSQRVKLVWFSSENVAANIYRRTAGSDWARVGSAYSDGSGRIIFEDTDIALGARYGYRLGIVEGGVETFYGESWVEVPNDLSLSLDGLSPNPARGPLVVAFTLPRGDRVQIELVDLAGRRVRAYAYDGLAPGRHAVRLDGARPVPGVYFLRLTQGGQSITKRAAVIQ